MQENQNPEKSPHRHSEDRINKNNNTNKPKEDNTNTLSAKSFTSDITNDDDMSSTSGSYIVDPESSLPDIECIYNNDTDV